MGQRLQIFSRRTTLAGVLITVAAVWLSLEGHAYLLHSPRFALRSLVLEGATRITREEVQARVGIREGDNIFRLSPSAIESRMAASPWTKSVHATRTLPGQITVHLEEHRAHMLLALDSTIPIGMAMTNAGDLQPGSNHPGGNYPGEQASTFLVDNEGMVFKAIESGDPVDFPVFSGLDGGRLQSDLVYRQEMMRDALWLLAHFPRSLGTVHEIHVDAGERFSLLFAPENENRTTRVELGKIADSNEAEARLGRVVRLVRTLRLRNRLAEYVLVFGDDRAHRAVVRLYE